MKFLNKTYSESEAREKALKLIFCVYQQEAQGYIASFGGHLFTKVPPSQENEPTYLQAVKIS